MANQSRGATGERAATPTRPLADIAMVQARLQWMREERIRPNRLRYLWTDAFGGVLLLSLFRALQRGPALATMRR